MDQQIENNQQIKKILQKASKPEVPLNFTSILMDKIYSIELTNKLFQRYIKRSWFFITLAFILALPGISQINIIGSAFKAFVDGLLPGVFEIFIYSLLIFISGLLLYQLNNLLSYKYANAN